tara:strand:- start:6147 stop:7409 length:1263 start_codon:yes stop_codon:yes gene_type:complete
LLIKKIAKNNLKLSIYLTLKNKKILFLGGAHHQCGIIRLANILNFHTICVDNVPDNPGHKIASSSKIISTMNKEKVLNYAHEMKIDGIICYGTDIALNTQEYICRKLELPGPPKNATRILSKKDIFRSFLNSKKLQMIDYMVFNKRIRKRDLKQINSFFENSINGLLIKPVDSSGGKGVLHITSKKNIYKYIDIAFKSSPSKTIILENYILNDGRQLCGDGFMLNGEIVFIGYGNGCFYDDKYAPYAEYFPSSLTKEMLKAASTKIKKIFDALGYKDGPFNLDIIFDHKNNPYVIELTPRLGGNFLSEAIYNSYGVNLDQIIIKYAIGEEIITSDFKGGKTKYIFNYMLHSMIRKFFFKNRLKLNKKLKNPVKLDFFIKENTLIEPFENGRDTFGNVMWETKNMDSLIELEDFFRANQII